MDRVKKLLSPGTSKKLMTNGGNRIFGVPLEELVLRATTGCKVPFLVHRICDFIENKGFHHEGIFRINGNAKIVEKLKTSFDVHGDANLEDEDDIMAVAGLLKLFLRELPDSVVPQHMTRQFVSIQEAYKNDNKGCINQIKQTVSELPEENYNLLKYLLRFLVVIAHNEKTNKMSPMSLAIVFGPNLFRCDQGIGGLKDQGTINQIVFKFIVHYESIFAGVNEELPVVEWNKPEIYDVNVNQSNHDHEEWDHSEGSSSTPLGRPLSPRFSDDETAGRASPFVLDRAVERVIAMTITENLFGDEDKSIANSIEFTKDLTNGDEGLESTDAGSTDKDDTKRDTETKSDEDAEFGSIKRNSATLSSFKRASGPQNRRSPSRKHRNSSGDPDMDNEVEELLTDVSNKLKNNVKLPSDTTDNEKNPSENLHPEDKVPIHHPVPKPRVAFLELTNNTGDINHRTSPDDTSPNRSPNNNRKPFIPPLDLTTLHEHVDSQDPILAHKGQSVSYQRAKTKINGEDGDDLQVILSPRTNKLTKRKHE
ncbi:hypothetical protein KUTeg_004384 [Tegillarca granosa]|uniref:Rho-GAP domain-containing protein n=1 Tax=Tegillarca granosa TaxID=220873 RepID=A0ABQ9FPU2_TEGGR|nr:hypothetical protein KUTeg_004384 [Tegillarca granosa]